MRADFAEEITPIYLEVFRELLKADGDKAEALAGLHAKGCDRKELCSRVAHVEAAKQLSRRKREDLYGPPERKMASLRKQMRVLADEYESIYESHPAFLSPYLVVLKDLNISLVMRNAAEEAYRHFKALRQTYNPKLFNLVFHQKVLLLRYVRESTKKRKPYLSKVAKLLGESEWSLEKTWRRYKKKKSMPLIDLGLYLDDPAVLGQAFAETGTNPPPK